MRRIRLRLLIGILAIWSGWTSLTMPVEAGRKIRGPQVTIKSVEPDTLQVQLGDRGKAGIRGENLQLAKGVIVRSGRAVSREITGELTCRTETVCTLVLSVSGSARPQFYAVILVDGDQRELVTLPLKFEVINRTLELEVASVDPDALSLKPGEAGKVKITGSNLNLAAAALVRRGRETIEDIKTSFACEASTLCVLEVEAAERAKAGAYDIVLVDQNRVVLVMLPMKFEIIRLLSEEPQRNVFIAPEPGVSFQRLCQDAPLGTSVTLLDPEAGAGLAVGSELVWSRTDHETCNGFGSMKRYVFTICNSPSAEFPCNPGNGLYWSVEIDPNVIGNGRCEVIPDGETPEAGVCQFTLADVAAQISGVETGDTVYWQMHYRADAFPDIRGAFTEKRPLLFNVAPVVPEPEPSCTGCPPPPTLYNPAHGSVIHATNRNFFWSDESPPNSPNDPNFPDWTWEVCLMKPPSETCVGGRPIQTIDNSLVGLSYYEFDEFGLIGGEMSWKVRACNESGQCGGFSVPRSAFVPLAPAERVYPVHRAEVQPGRTFIWRPVEGADFYRLVLGLTYEDGVPFQFRQLVRQTDDPQQKSIFLTAQSLQALDNTIPNEHLGKFTSWYVRACYDPDGPGEIDAVCSDTFFAPLESFGSSAIVFTQSPNEVGEVSFDALVDTFRSPRCMNCHAVETTNFVVGGDGTFGLPGGSAAPPDRQHPSISGAEGCPGCHSTVLDGVLPAATHPDITWSPAPAGMDFRAAPGVVKSFDDLCAAAQNSGTIASDVADHLAGDPLILWAVVGGPLPFGRAPGAPGFQGTLAEWQQLVHDWFNAGMPCEKPL